MEYSKRILKVGAFIFLFTFQHPAQVFAPLNQFNTNLILVKHFSHQHKVNDILSTAICLQESGCVKTKRSHKNAYGVMQVREIAAKDAGCKGQWKSNTRLNIQCGVKYISLLQTRHKNASSKTLACLYYSGNKTKCKTKQVQLYTTKVTRIMRTLNGN